MKFEFVDSRNDSSSYYCNRTEYPQRKLKGKPLLRGTRHLMLNHIQAWENIVRKNDQAFVFEDDARFDARRLNTDTNAFLSHNLSFDIFWVGFCLKPIGPIVKPFTIALRNAPGCSFAYLLHKRGAIKLLQQFPLHTCFPSDVLMERLSHKAVDWTAFSTARAIATHRHRNSHMHTR